MFDFDSTDITSWGVIPAEFTLSLNVELLVATSSGTMLIVDFSSVQDLVRLLRFEIPFYNISSYSRMDPLSTLKYHQQGKVMHVLLPVGCCGLPILILLKR